MFFTVIAFFYKNKTYLLLMQKKATKLVAFFC
ncbi:hypothetical protein M472_20135 [Sphingobacterium paucimobilis HER1398]|uniref:Uncharacterized protein n=1 Tax=Sphingobacterium paucimobilis HER1398 TaxID=1346330 RepID=U2HZW2_9SPHI|nr:hypothetical protein M472_20135 [Sphingobacterium paucimobilis HER1398]